MDDGRLVLDLEPTKDRFGKTYYIAKLKGPLLIDCKDGICILVYTSIEGEEQLQIANMRPPKNKNMFNKNTNGYTQDEYGEDTEK